MRNLSNNFFLVLNLLTLCFFMQSCTEELVQPEKQKVQFTLTPASASAERVGDFTLPETARAIISLASSNGSIALSDLQVSVYEENGNFVTEALELAPGDYTVTDFMIENEDEGLYLAPKKDIETTRTQSTTLPLAFTVIGNNVARIDMHVVDVRDQDLDQYGYASKAKGNTLTVELRNSNGTTVTTATAELRQNSKLIQSFSLNGSTNTINFTGNNKLPYTLTVFTSNSAITRTFDIKKLKHEIGKKPLQLVLEPALFLKIQSYVDEANEYEDYFEFRMDGSGSVNINWGDGGVSTATLPFEISHEYFSGDFTAIVTGDINKVTDFSGFSYSTIISSITGLTNLTSLKVYDPSWGAVPIKVDLSNCKQLERINVAKYGAPYEPCDLRTEFKLPSQHYISTFIFDAPSFDSNREYISAEELEVMVDKIYQNVINRQIRNGKFFVNPVVAPSASTQQKLDVMQNQYNWQVGFNDEIYYAYELTAGRSKNVDTESKREQWIRARFSNAEKIIQRSAAAHIGG